MSIVRRSIERIVIMNFILIVAWISCNSEKIPEQSLFSPNYLASIKLLELGLSSEQSKWKVGSHIFIRASTTNKGKVGLKVTRTAYWHQYQISVIAGDDKQAAKSLFFEKQLKYPAVSIRAQEIKSGGTVEEKIRISDLFDFTKVGDYKITFKRPFYSNGKLQHELVSNTITISVVP